MAKHMRAKRRRSGRVTISYLPAFGPAKTKFPFRAWINGEPVTVWPDRIERER